MKYLSFVLISLLTLTGSCISQPGQKSKENKPEFLKWAQTPPMGWNSWDCYGPTVTEAEVKANADYMAEHLLNTGLI